MAVFIHQSCSVLPLRSAKAREFGVVAGKNVRAHVRLRRTRWFFPASTLHISRALTDRSGRTEQLWCSDPRSGSFRPEPVLKTRAISTSEQEFLNKLSLLRFCQTPCSCLQRCFPQPNHWQPRSQALSSPERKTLVGSGHVTPTFWVLTNKINVEDVLRIDSCSYWD